MSEVRRYEFDENGVCYHKEDGSFISFDDYARLEAEVERLRIAHADALADFWAIHKGYFDLKAEVEQLRKDGKPSV